MATWTIAYDYSFLRIIATELSTNPTTNTSRVQVIAELYSNGEAYNRHPQVLTVEVAGTTIATVSNITYSFTSAGTKNLGSWIVTINRSSNSNSVNIKAEISDKGYLGDTGTSAIIDEYLSLSSIAQASVPTLSSTNIIFGESVRITTNRLNTSYTHRIVWSIGTLSGTISNSAGASVNWTPPNSIAEAFPNNLSGVVTIVVTTFSGSAEVGSNSINLTINIDTTSIDFIPYVQKPTLTEKNVAIKNNIGNVWIQNQSIIGLTTGSVADHGAAIVSGAIILNPGPNAQRLNANLNTQYEVVSQDIRLNTAGTYHIAVEVVDSRGLRSISEAQTITILTYQTPRLSNVTANRNVDTPTTIELQATGTGLHLTNRNTLTMTAYIRGVGETAWDESNRVVSNTSNNGVVSINQSFAGYSEALSYEVRIELKDEISGNQVSIVTIGTTTVLIDAYKDEGIGIGKLYEPEFGANLQIGDKGVYSQGEIATTVSIKIGNTSISESDLINLKELI